MFEPDYSETMSMLLDAIGRQQSDILPQEDLKTDAAQYLDIVKKIEKNRTQDVCGDVEAITSISEQISEKIDGCEKKEVEFDGFSKSDRSILKKEKQQASTSYCNM